MRAASSDLRLTVLTRLGHRLSTAVDAEAAAGEAVRTLGGMLHVAAVVVAVHDDMGEMVAAHVPPGLDMRLTPALAHRLVGLRVPLAGVDSLRRPVDLRRPYTGFAGNRDTLRRLASDSGLASALPTVADGLPEVSAPVMVRDRVAAVLGIWGERSTPDLAPVLEAAAAMLATFWTADERPDAERFPAPATARPRAQLRRAIESLLREGSLAAAVQPITRLYDGSVIGYEALARFPPRPRLLTPDDLFGSASALGMQAKVDLACLRAALREAPKFGGADLFVNVLIGTLLDPVGMAALDDAIRAAGVDPNGVVVEFSEREPVPDLARLQRIAAELRSRGFRIAVDDAGSGHASMRVIAELRPEFIKVDRSLIHAVDTDRARSALVVALLSFSGHIGARLVAEGVETAAEEATLQSLGVMFGQGWRLGMPVLTHPIKGHPTVEVVDDAWFAHRTVSPIREASALEMPATMPSPTVPLSRGRGRPRGGLARALSDAAHALQSEHDPMRIVGVIAELMTRVVPVSEMAIFAADYETHRMIPMLATGPDQDEILADTFSLDAGLTGWAFMRGFPENVPDTSAHPLARQVPGTPVVPESLLLVPLVAGEHKLGIINCWRLGIDKFSSHEVEAAALFAHIAAAAWRNAQLYAELVSAAMTDPLTRLYNSRWLRDTGERDFSRAMRDGRPLSMLLVDLDHFKKVNDGGGHAAGDLVLQRVATRLRATVRGADAVVRLGGEEFVALLQDCDPAGAIIVAEAVRKAVRDIPLPENCGLERLTASVGLAAFPDHGLDLESVLAAADRAMYAAKQGGRDRVVGAAAVAGDTILPLTPSRRRSRHSRHSGATVTSIAE